MNRLQLAWVMSREDYVWDNCAIEDEQDDSSNRISLPNSQGDHNRQNSSLLGTPKKINWSPELLMWLVSITKKHKGHLTERKSRGTLHVTEEVKWDRIVKDLSSIRCFTGYDLKSSAVKKKFDKLLKDTAKMANLNQEGNNVSGFNPQDRITKLILDLI